MSVMGLCRRVLRLRYYYTSSAIKPPVAVPASKLVLEGGLGSGAETATTFRAIDGDPATDDLSLTCALPCRRGFSNSPPPIRYLRKHLATAVGKMPVALVVAASSARGNRQCGRAPASAGAFLAICCRSKFFSVSPIHFEMVFPRSIDFGKNAARETPSAPNAAGLFFSADPYS